MFVKSHIFRDPGPRSLIFSDDRLSHFSRNAVIFWRLLLYLISKFSPVEPSSRSMSAERKPQASCLAWGHYGSDCAVGSESRSSRGPAGRAPAPQLCLPQGSQQPVESPQLGSMVMAPFPAASHAIVPVRQSLWKQALSCLLEQKCPPPRRLQAGMWLLCVLSTPVGDH